ncbi:glycosyltransferase family 4 protein [Mucilaginibacter calamicampi]|uniref:Glycosyltransferase family 4 protein n=1 Tax=Mucilaginibacter calamicampi TaxID=1302352 RepID=A0ABW2YXJ4_9SPHI
MHKPLIIGVDVRDLKVAKTGTRTYLLELCREFKEMQRDNLRFEFLDTNAAVYTGNNKLLKWAEHLRYQIWKQVILPLKARSKGCDIVFCTDNFVPLIRLGYQTIPVFHDAFFFETPRDYGRLWLWLYKKTALPAARRSPVIITPTEHSKRRLQSFTGINAEKFAVVFEGARNSEKSAGQVGLDTLRLPIKLKQYILHVGSFFKRKNLPALITAFAKLKAAGYTELKLVLAGPLPASKTENDYREVIEAITKNNVENDVVLTGYLSDNDLDLLYKNALLYAFPSVNEGFGLPVLEAFSNDLPVVVSNNTCLPEVGGQAVLSFDPFDTDDIFKTIKSVLDDEALRDTMIFEGRERLKEFSWKKTAEQLVEIFKRVVNYS